MENFTVTLTSTLVITVAPEKRLTQLPFEMVASNSKADADLATDDGNISEVGEAMLITQLSLILAQAVRNIMERDGISKIDKPLLEFSASVFSAAQTHLEEV